MSENKDKAAAMDGDDPISRARRSVPKPSVKPKKIFIYQGAVSKYGLLNAAIIGELFYWFSIGKNKFYRRAKDHAEIFHCSRSAISNHHKQLYDAGVIERSRPYSKKHGGRLAYDYTIKDSQEARLLLSQYKFLLNKASDKGTSDFGQPNFESNDSQTAVIRPWMATVFTSVIDEIQDLTTAYLYSRLAWLSNNADYQGGATFNNKKALAEWAILQRATTDRHLRKLEALNLIEVIVYPDHAINIRFNINASLYKTYQDYFENVFKQRKEGMFLHLEDQGHFNGFLSERDSDEGTWDDYI